MFRGCNSVREEKSKPSNSQWFKLFKEKKTDETVLEATEAARLIVHGGEEEVKRALALVDANPKILECKVIVEDRLKIRRLEGYLISIAAIVGDTLMTDSHTHEKEQKDNGMVNQLIEVNYRKNYLSAKTVLKHLEVVTSQEAKIINAKRNETILNFVIEFGEGLIALQDDEYFSHHCKELAIQLDEKLKKAITRVYTAGFLFDLNIICDVIKWFKNNEQRFGNSKINYVFGEDKVFQGAMRVDPLFWKKVNEFWKIAYGKLQALLSARDGHFALHFDLFYTPKRTLKNDDNTTYFISDPFVSASDDNEKVLGRDFCLDASKASSERMAVEAKWVSQQANHYLRYYETVVKNRKLNFQFTQLTMEQQQSNCCTM